MATVDLTSLYHDFLGDYGHPTPHWNLTARVFRKQQWNIEHIHRRVATKNKASFDGSLGELVPFWWDNVYRQHTPDWVDNRFLLTAPQFTGTVAPAGVYAVRLCKRDPYTKRTQILEITTTDASGNFEFKGFYPVGNDIDYFYQVDGDSTFESNDFLLTVPQEHQRQVGKDSRSGPVTYDTRLGHRVLYVEDQFNDVSGTNLAVHTPDVDTVGSGWESVGGTIQVGDYTAIPGEQVAYSSSSGPIGAIQTGDADVLMHLPLYFGESSIGILNHGAILRYVDSLNYLEIAITGANAANPILALREYVAGTPSIVQQKPLIGAAAFTLNQLYMMKVLCKGDKFWYEINLGNRIWGDCYFGLSTHQNATKHGFRIGQSGMYAQAIKIWSV